MYKLNKKNIYNANNNTLLVNNNKHSLKSVIINSISASIIIIFLLLVFEVLFYFLVTKHDITSYLKHINKKLPPQYIAVEEVLINILDDTIRNNINNNSLNSPNTEQNNNSPDIIKNIMVHKNNDETVVFFTKTYRDKLVELFSKSVNELIDTELNNFNTNVTKKYIEFSLYVGLYVIIVLAFHYLNKNSIEWGKIAIILLFSYTLIIICELFFYYKVYSEVRLINDNKLINNIIQKFKKMSMGS